MLGRVVRGEFFHRQMDAEDGFRDVTTETHITSEAATADGAVNGTTIYDNALIPESRGLSGSPVIKGAETVARHHD